MQKTLLFPVGAIILALVSGCGRDQPAAPAEQQAAAEAKDKGASAIPARTPPVTKPKPDFPAKLASTLVGSSEAVLGYDRVRDLPGNGGKQRQVFIEVLGLSADQAEARVVDFLTQEGYQSAHRSSSRAGSARHSMVKRGAPSLSVLIRSREAGPPLKNADATSSIYIVTRAD